MNFTCRKRRIFSILVLCISSFIFVRESYAATPQELENLEELKTIEAELIRISTNYYSYGFSFEEIAFVFGLNKNFVIHEVSSADNFLEMYANHAHARYMLRIALYSVLKSNPQLIDNIENGKLAGIIRLYDDLAIPFQVFQRFVDTEKLIDLFRIETLYQQGLYKKEIDSILEEKKITFDTLSGLLPQLKASEKRRKARHDFAFALFISERENKEMIPRYEVLQKYLTKEIRERLLKEVEGNFPPQIPEVVAEVVTPPDPDPYGIEELIRAHERIGIDISTEELFLERLRAGASGSLPELLTGGSQLRSIPLSPRVEGQIGRIVRLHFRQRARGCNLFLVSN